MDNSSKTLTVACVQTHWPKPIDYNIRRTEHYINVAAESGARVVLFPEANLTSYYFPRGRTDLVIVGYDATAEAVQAIERGSHSKLTWPNNRAISAPKPSMPSTVI